MSYDIAGWLTSMVALTLMAVFLVSLVTTDLLKTPRWWLWAAFTIAVLSVLSAGFWVAAGFAAGWIWIFSAVSWGWSSGRLLAERLWQ